MRIQGRTRRRALGAALAALTIAASASTALIAGTAASASVAPALTLTLERGSIRVSWRFTALSTRDGTALDIEGRIGAGSWARVSYRSRPRPSGSVVDKRGGVGTFSYRARLTGPGVDMMSAVATLQVGPTTTTRPPAPPPTPVTT